MLATRSVEDVALILVAIGLGGFMLGFGLVIGAFVARTLRRYMRDQELNGRS